MTRLLLSMLVLGLLVFGFPAAAQQQSTADQAFTQLDTDKDGKLSETEFAAMFDSNTSDDQRKQAFARWDANGDKYISKEEFTANYAGGGGQQKKQ